MSTLGTLIGGLFGLIDTGPKIPWIYENRSPWRVEVRLYAKEPRKGITLRTTQIEPGAQDPISASRNVSAAVFALTDARGRPCTPICIKEGPIHRVCTEQREAAARVFAVSRGELERMAEDARRASRQQREDPDEVLPFIRTELEPLETTTTSSPLTRAATRYTRTAAFRMRDRGGLHVRPTVLIQKALREVDFAYVEATHTKNGRQARMYGPQADKLFGGVQAERGAAFWMLLLRLKARRDEVVEFTAAADAPEKAEAALAVVEGVLGRVVPKRFDYWRDLGAEGYVQTYMSDVRTSEAREILKQLLDPAGGTRLEQRRMPVNQGPMANRVDQEEGWK